MAELLNANEIFFTPFEPKVTNRFIMYVEGIPAFLIKTTDRPSMTNGEIVLDHINVDHKIKGKSRWNDINLSLYDAIVPSAAQAVMEWVRLHHESVTGRDGYRDMYKKDITLNALGPLGDKVEEWTLKGAYAKEVNFNNMDYSTDEAMMIDITIAYDYAVLQY